MKIRRLTGAGQDNPSLYGLNNSSRDFSSPYAWGKNQFNSAFPAALACYMRDNKMPAVYIVHGKASNTSISEISFDDFWQTRLPNERLFFFFESRFEPYQSMTIDVIQPIDLVVLTNDQIGRASCRERV